MTVKLEGFEELYKELEQLPDNIKKNVAGKVVRSGSTVVLKDARRRAPRRTNQWEGMKYKNEPGTLKKGIKVQRARKQPRWIVRDQIGFSNKAWYGRLVELGHKLVRKGKQIGFVSPRPFLRPAFDNNVSNILTAMREKLAEELKKLK